MSDSPMFYSSENAGPSDKELERELARKKKKLADEEKKKALREQIAESDKALSGRGPRISGGGPTRSFGFDAPATDPNPLGIPYKNKSPGRVNVIGAPAGAPALTPEQIEALSGVTSGLKYRPSRARVEFGGKVIDETGPMTASLPYQDAAAAIASAEKEKTRRLDLENKSAEREFQLKLQAGSPGVKQAEATTGVANLEMQKLQAQIEAMKKDFERQTKLTGDADTRKNTLRESLTAGTGAGVEGLAPAFVKRAQALAQTVDDPNQAIAQARHEQEQRANAIRSDIAKLDGMQLTPKLIQQRMGLVEELKTYSSDPTPQSFNQPAKISSLMGDDPETQAAIAGLLANLKKFKEKDTAWLSGDPGEGDITSLLGQAGDVANLFGGEQHGFTKEQALAEVNRRMRDDLRGTESNSMAEWVKKLMDRIQPQAPQAQ
jgi:hypothetical protein